MIHFTPYHYEHLLYIRPQFSQTIEYEDVLRPQGQAVMRQGFGLTAWEDGYKALGAAGLWPAEPHRAVAWCVLSAECRPHMARFTRHIRFFLANCGFKRVEMVAAGDFAAANRWATMLGFKCETPNGMQGYFPNGKSGVLYARNN